MKDCNIRASLNWTFYLNRFLVIGFLSILAISCAQKKALTNAADQAAVYPSPPDTARIQYLTSLSSSKDIEKKRGDFKKYVLGEEDFKPIIKPYGAAFYKSKVFICDLDLEGLEIIDLNSGEFNYFIPKGIGKLQLPINCSIDSVGDIYIADVKRRQIVVFNKDLEFITSIGGDENFKPTDVFVTRDKVWVCNIINGSIDVFKKDSAYTFLYSITGTKSKEGKLYQPTNLFVTQEKVYVSDFGEFNIKIYDHSGEYLTTIGSYGKNIGQFTRPKGIMVDNDENLYVVDAAFENVQIFDKEGQLLMFFGGSYREPGGMWLPAKIAISYDNNNYFKKYVNSRYNLKFVILVTNNFGPDKISVYGSIELKSNKKPK